MKAKLVVVFILVITSSVLGYLLLKKNIQEPKEVVHYHAGFQVYKDDKRVNFSDIRYMHIEPCVEGEQQHQEDEQLEKAHLHDGVGDVVHVHRNSALWKDLFKNISYLVEGDVITYRNGKKVADFLTQPIASYDSVIFFIGKNSNVEEKITRRVTKKHIEEVEKRSEKCGS